MHIKRKIYLKSISIRWWKIITLIGYIWFSPYSTNTLIRFNTLHFLLLFYISVFKMSRRVNPLSLRLYKSKNWPLTYTVPLYRNSKIFHQTVCIDLYLRTKINQKFFKKRTRF